jgi:hypothetical protein
MTWGLSTSVDAEPYIVLDAFKTEFGGHIGVML